MRRRSLRTRMEERAGERCEYCQAPQAVCAYTFHMEHVVPVALGGADEESNRALACAPCNLAKGDRVSGVDPVSGERVSLFNPRTQIWAEHFAWNVVMNLPRTKSVHMEAEDNVFSLYEMDNGCIGVFHIARALHPMPAGAGGGGFRIFGTGGNLITGVGGNRCSIISERKDLLPEVGADGWYNVQPSPNGFNYYNQSTRHCSTASVMTVTRS